MKYPQSINRAVSALLFIMLILALSLSVMRFWLLPKAASYKDAIAAEVSSILGQSVEIKRLHARLDGFNPEVSLEGLAVLQDGKPVFEFKRASFALSLFSSILHMSPILQSIRLNGAELTVLRNSDGSFSLQGLIRNKESPPPTWLLGVGRIELSQIDLNFQDALKGPESVALGRLDVSVHSSGAKHRLNMHLDSLKSSKIRLAFDGKGDSFDRLSGRLYIKAQRLDPRYLDLLPSPFRFFSADLSLWGDLSSGGLTGLLGRVELLKPHFVDQAIAFESLSGNLRAQKQAKGWRLDVDRFKLAREGHVWPESRMAFYLHQDDSGGLKALSGAVSYGSFEDLTQFLPELSPYGVKGLVKDARFFYEPLQKSWAICGDFFDLAANPVLDSPGIKSVNARLCGDDKSGFIKLASESLELNAPKLFNQALQLDVKGFIRWQKSLNDWRIKADDFKLKGPGLEASTRFELIKPDHAPLFLSLKAGLTDVDAGAIRNYLPLVAMNEASSNWLGKGFVSGKVKRANIVFSGFFADFPFDKSEGVFQALAELENLELDIHPNWPHIHDLNGLAFFDKAGMYIDARNGRMNDVKLSNVHTDTFDFNLDPWLYITGEAEASLAQAMDLLAQTPLSSIPERLLKVAEPIGDTHVALKLKIPLGDQTATADVKGTASLNNAQLRLKGIDQVVEKINGQLNFTQDGLYSQGIKASVLDEPVNIDLAQADGIISIDAKGAVDVHALKKAFPSHFWKYAQGDMDYHLNLGLPESMDTQGAPISLSFYSDLHGFGLHLPEPLAKAERFKKDFKLDLQFLAGGKTSLNLAYGQEASARLSFADSAQGLKLEGGDLILGSVHPQSAHHQGLALFARLDELDLSEWRKLLGGDASGGAGLQSYDVEVQRLFYEDQAYGHASLAGVHSGDVWFGQFNSTRGQGAFQATLSGNAWPHLKLDLEALKLPEPSGSASKSNLDPHSLPNMQVTVKQLLWKDIDLGRLDLELGHEGAGLRIKKLLLQKKNQTLSLRKGSWFREQGQDETQVEGDLSVQDMGDLIAEWGYQHEINDTPLQAAFNLNWNDSPQNFSTRLLSGDIRLNLGRGAILKMDPGLGRALGMLNLTTLSRILLLDFSDMFGKGLAYDSMKGRFHIDKGQADTGIFLIDAVAAKIAISGKIDLVEKLFDQKIAVIPHTLAALPLAGGAAVGEVLSAAGNLIGAGDHAIAGSHYSVKGSWDHPIVTRIGGSMSIDLFNQAWTGLKDLSGFGKTGDDK